MRRGKDYPVNASTLINAAFPRNAAKHLEQEIGCSRRQAWRMIQTGKVPVALRESVLRLVDLALAQRQAELGIVADELRRIAALETEARAASRRPPARLDNPAADLAAQPPEQTTLPLLERRDDDA